MNTYKTVTLDLFMDAAGVNKLQDVLAGYSCPLNEEIEDFLKHKSIDFSKQGIAKTHLVFTQYKDQPVLVGFFALASKTLFVKDKARLSANLRRRIRKFATRMEETGNYVISAPLIAQLGKNYTNGYHQLISGDVLLSIACEKIRETQLAVGGKVAYLECQEVPALIAFYERNGFQCFDKRRADSYDREKFQTEYLVQMIKYFG